MFNEVEKKINELYYRVSELETKYKILSAEKLASKEGIKKTLIISGTVFFAVSIFSYLFMCLIGG
ncbi:MAG: hypothetical protein QNK36_10465 [Colwellia sp.]|nr:hypothetical protein [Colwellia sp.]